MTEDNPPTSPPRSSSPTGLLDVLVEAAADASPAAEDSEEYLRALHASMAQAHEDALHTHQKKMKEMDDEEETSIQEAKASFALHVQAKLEKISLRSNIVRFKYDSYKRWYDMVQIGIILASTALSVVETIKAELQLTKTKDKGTNSLFSLIPVFLATSTAVAASILKFKRYQERIEEMNIAIEKSIMVTFRLKRVLEDIRHVHSMEELDKIRAHYSKDTYTLYCQTQEQMERTLKYSDLVQHMETYHALTLQYQRSEYDFEIKSAQMAQHADQQRQLEGGEEKEGGATQPSSASPCCIVS